jgi:DNA polymerase alpha subunit A
MAYEYPDKKLYNQLLYFAGMWDAKKAKETVKASKEYEVIRDRVVVLAEANKASFAVVKGVVDAYLRKCGRQWVEMDSLFGFALGN